eukprot:scaffold781_cov394-Prasinococcus_capsulatus_cf.AAC.12
MGSVERPARPGDEAGGGPGLGAGPGRASRGRARPLAQRRPPGGAGDRPRRVGRRHKRMAGAPFLGGLSVRWCARSYLFAGFDGTTWQYAPAAACG